MASDEQENSKPDSQKTVISTAAPTGVAIGTQIMGTFEITEHIATGGMGEVYRGFNIHTEEPVAIKIVLAALAHDEKILSLFQKEATVLGRLHHDAIVRYMLFTVDPGIQRACLVMEFVEGRSLADYYAEEGKMPVEDVKTMMRRVASGLQKAHDLGVVHRDLSPDNVVIQDGLISHTKIIDFGIAKSANFGGGTLLGGQFAGKYGYVSPEQLGRFKGVIEGTSDIYSLALVAAAACRGEPIDMGDSPAEAVERRMDVPDLSGVHDELRPLLEMMLSPDPANRPESMAKVLEYIDNPAALAGGAAPLGVVPGPGGSVPPQQSVPPQYSQPPQSIPPQQSMPPGGGPTVISQPPQYAFTTPPQQSMPPQSMPPQDVNTDSPFPGSVPPQRTGVGTTLPPASTVPPPQPAEKKGKGGLIAALLALVIVGGGAGAYFGGFIPGVNQGGGGTGTEGTDGTTGTDGTDGTTTTAGGDGSTTTGCAGTVRFDDSGNPIDDCDDGTDATDGGDTSTADGGDTTPTTDGGDTTTADGGDTTTTTDGGDTTTDGGDTTTTADGGDDTTEGGDTTTTTDGGDTSTDGGDTTTTADNTTNTDGTDTTDGANTTAPPDQLAGGEIGPVDDSLSATEGTVIAREETPTTPGQIDFGTIGRMISWVNSYSTPLCVHVGIRSAVPDEFEIEGYATSVDPLYELLTAFREEFDTDPKIGARLVDDSQCSVVTFVKNITRSEARPPALKLDRDVLKAGDPIRGTIDLIEGRTITLFLIDSRGGAYNLTSRLKPQEDGTATFALALRPQGADDREIVPYLMLAIATENKIGSADTQAGTPTSSLMPIIQAEIRQRGTAEQNAASAALGYFRFDDDAQ
ncbi:protein kinase [Vannielia litorea]|uniref:protein kinase domain-containing protein n=1 Tax=Vannielia litorea TaxID=1217970 RepID=UPI001C953BE8|nr:protein kinase [Vannielia litorea]MBY6152192.1 protein kinase [Vannielia litorea]